MTTTDNISVAPKVGISAAASTELQSHADTCLEPPDRKSPDRSTESIFLSSKLDEKIVLNMYPFWDKLDIKLECGDIDSIIT
mmetsp:Transcript_7088/g.10763  ORF Transcript_7088/g.10763 Transcript_7088/m.10763 type:complete len:82 (-) Transcript_7088:132-377(-)